MKIVALEFSSSQRSVAVLDATTGGQPLAIAEAVESSPGGGAAFQMIEESLDRANIGREQVECLAVGLGPGSYTGIRSAIAMAQGWQLAAEVNLLGISSVDCMAFQVWADGIRGHLHVLVDAQRNECYWAAYDLDGQGYHCVTDLRLTSPDHLRDVIDPKAIIAGPEATRWFPRARLIFPRASTLGRLALERTDYLPGEGLQPIYLRETSFVKAPSPRFS